LFAGICTEVTPEKTIRSAIGSDAGRISALLTGLAEEFIVPAFAAAGRNQLLAEFAAAKIARENVPSPAGPFSVNASSYAVPAYRRLGFRLAGPAQERNGVQFQPMEWAADPAAAR
jgi:hypothetical protein